MRLNVEELEKRYEMGWFGITWKGGVQGADRGWSLQTALSILNELLNLHNENYHNDHFSTYIYEIYCGFFVICLSLWRNKKW